jgi:hypothetical protein
MQGIDLEEKGMPEEASRLFLQAWNEATNDFEKFTAAYYSGPASGKRDRQIKLARKQLCSLH